MNENKVKELKQNQEFKNYKVVCEYLEETVKGGKSKQLQIEDWNRYFSYHKVGNKFIIDEVYDTPKEKVENRGGNNKGKRKKICRI